MANEARIIRRSLADLKSEKDQTDWARVDALTDEEIDGTMNKLIRTFEKELGASLRG